MELTISLAHFCDNHGPTSIICTQAQPISCFSCDPASVHSSSDDLENTHRFKQKDPRCPRQSKKDVSLDFSDVHDSSAAYTPSEKEKKQTQENANTHYSIKSQEPWEPADATLSKREDSFNFEDAHEHGPPIPPGETSSGLPNKESTSRRQTSNPRHHQRRPTATDVTNVGCTNCALSLPSSSLPRSAAASPTPSSTPSPPSSLASSTSSPKLRSQFPVRVYEDPTDSGYSSSTSTSCSPHFRSSAIQSKRKPHYLAPHPVTAASSFASTASTASTASAGNLGSYHDHTLTYLSTHAPLRSSTYTSLRRAIVKTLSGENLPRGLTSGRIFFEDVDPSDSSLQSDGNDPAHPACCIAYTFRLSDRYARGGGRMYAFVALVTGATTSLGGTARGDVYGLVARIWGFFEGMAQWLGSKVEKEWRKEEDEELVHRDENGKTADEADDYADQRQRHRYAAVVDSDNSTVSPTMASSFLTSSRGGGTGASDWSAFGGRGNRGGTAGSGAVAGGGMGMGMKGPVLLKGRGLPEMTGDEKVFAKVHMRFVELLREIATST